jgi:AraC-like DNA-binding protein
MMYEDSAESAVSLNALVRSCQLLVGDALNWEDWPDFAAIAQRFADVPDASSYAEAVTAVGLVVQFTHRLGENMHHRVHADERTAGCPFHPPNCSLAAQVPVDWPCAWNAGQVMQGWLFAYERAFTGAHRHDIVQRAKRRLQSCDVGLTVKGLARELGCSVAVLQRRFAKETGETLTRYRQRLRAVAAIELLRSSDAKIETIARAVGWKSKKELYKALAKFAQMTPAAVRRLSPSDASALAARISRSRTERHHAS